MKVSLKGEARVRVHYRLEVLRGFNDTSILRLEKKAFPLCFEVIRSFLKAFVETFITHVLEP